MTFTTVLASIWGVISKVLSTAVTYVEGTQIGSLVKADIQKLGALAAVYTVELAFVIVPLAGLRSIVYLPLAVALVLIPNVVAQFQAGK